MLQNKHTLRAYDGTKLFFEATRDHDLSLMLLDRDVKAGLEHAYRENFDLVTGSLCMAWGPSTVKEVAPHVYCRTFEDVDLYGMHKVDGSWREDPATRRVVRIEIESDFTEQVRQLAG
jgi:hypothetical protein